MKKNNYRKQTAQSIKEQSDQNTPEATPQHYTEEPSKRVFHGSEQAPVNFCPSKASPCLGPNCDDIIACMGLDNYID